MGLPQPRTQPTVPEPTGELHVPMAFEPGWPSSLTLPRLNKLSLEGGRPGRAAGTWGGESLRPGHRGGWTAPIGMAPTSLGSFPHLSQANAAARAFSLVNAVLQEEAASVTSTPLPWPETQPHAGGPAGQAMSPLPGL